MPDQKDILAEALGKGAKLEADGHTIFAPEMYVKDGWPEAFVESLVREYESDLSNPKATITKDGKIVPKLRGVYNLDFLYAVAHTLGVEYEDKMGRGFQARCIVDALERFRKEWRCES